MAITVLRFPPGGGLDLELSASDAEIHEYSERCSKLLHLLQRPGVVVLELEDDSAWAPLKACLKRCDSFFSLDRPIKEKASSSVPGEGFSRPNGKELLAFRRFSGASGLAAGNAQSLDGACRVLDSLGRSVLRGVSRSAELDIHAEQLSPLLEEDPQLRRRPSASILRASCYPDVAEEEGPPALAFAAHHDRGVLTLVASNQTGGLQVQLPPGAGGGGGEGVGEWADVPLGPGRVAVLVGFSLSYALGGLVRPALHRVAPGGPRRVSLAYELCFRPGARIDPAEVLREAATAPERPVGRPLYLSELMALFETTHPVSINGKRSLDVGACRFLFEWRRIGGNSTPEELGLKDGNVIIVVMEQVGS
ncbi:hypothetical protein GPECTOR_25g354 [Gonium pectorale]|uniref:Fe2OG dioxygenase domain-containing protein n=1 Tax=Gonium pectorale TaxID=33097 RepID=A0A150GHD3_GONPE|nr:hypothetical protein GPECTOR_25g354 [Gonium pectorale]|eukprot:KXZ48770.1 hypothetical protein GPECTOR_25g354 [Gonium pectorale]